jgi:citrate lyase subunit beta/citryl-CoA lyase
MIPTWQAQLFVPVGAERHLASAIRHRPDAVILDLEDAVAADRKEEARARLRMAQAQLAAAGLDCLLRVNKPVRQMVRDLEAADLGALAALILPKCESAGQITVADDILADLAGEGRRPGLVALIETPAAFLNLREIGQAPGLVGMMLGSEDYGAALGVSPEEGALDYPAAGLAATCASRGLLPIGLPGSLANYKDLDRYGQNLLRGRRLGFRAVAAIHPAQLPVIRAVLAPTAEELAWAEQIVAAAERSGAAVAGSKFGMIDAPVVARARTILANGSNGARQSGASPSP